MSSSWFLLVAIVAILFGLLYPTISPSVAGGDSGELIAQGCELGIAHPPGYPLYTLFIAGLRLIHSYVGTSQELAYFVNVSSTVFTILAAYFIGSSVELSSFKTSNNKDFGTRLDTSLSILFAMLLFTFSPLIWQYSTTAEVFPMNTFFASLLIYLVLLFSSTRSVGVAYIGAFVCGLALCNQHTILLLELHLVVWVLYLLRPQVYTNPIILLNLSALFMLGLTPYVYLPLAGWYNPTGGSWGHPSTWSGFINHILRRDYGTFSVYSGNTSHISNMERFLMRAKLYIEDLCFQQGLYVVPILAVVGIAVQWKWSKTTVKQISNTMTLPSARAKIRDKNTSEASSSSSSSSTDSANIDTVKSTKKSTTPVRRKSIKGSVTKKQALSTSSTSTQLLSSLSLPSSNISVLQVIQTAVAVTSSVVVSGSEAVYTLTVLFISYSFYLLVFHSLSNLPLSETLLYAIHQRFWMQPNVLVFYWSGVGLFSLFQAARKVLKTIANYDNIESGGINCGQNSNNSNTVLATSKPSKPPSIIIIESIFNLFISLLVLLATYRQYHTWLPVSDQHKATYFRQYAHSVLAPLPLNAVLFINYDQQWSSVRYIQQCLHIRPDITTINLSMMSYPWFTYKQSLFPHLKFPGNYLTSPHSATIHTENAFTFLSFLHANIKQHKVFLGGKLNYADPQLFEEFSLVPVGLVSQFIPVTKASNASVYLTQFKRNIKTVLSQLHTLPDPEQYSSNTWEWTIDRDFKDRIGLSAAYALQLSVESAYHDPASLVYTAYILESAIALEYESSSVPSSVLKNAGLAHVHLIQNKMLPENSTLAISTEDDIFHTLVEIGWPVSMNSTSEEVPIKWKDWCTERFIIHWSEFLSRSESKLDKQYDNIKSLYDAALSKGASMKQRIRKRKKKTKKPPRRSTNPWAKR